MSESTKRSLRIGIDARPLARRFNGVSVYLAEVLGTMMATSDHLWFLYSNAPIDLPDSWKAFANYTLRCGNSRSRWHSTIFVKGRFPTWASQDEIDLFWSPRHQLPPRLPTSLPRVVTLHDLVFITHPETMTRGGALLERLHTPISLYRATRIMTTSQAMRKTLEQHFPREAEVAWLGGALNPASKTLEPDIPKGLRYVLFCGSIEPRKNLDRLIKAIARLNKESSNAPLHLVVVTGGGWKSESTFELLTKHNDIVYVKSGLSEAEKAGFYKHAWCLALPSLQEGFGLPLIEAINYALPIVTTRRGSLPEIAGDAAIYVDPEDVVSIAQGLSDLLKSPKRYAELSSVARKRKELFSWQQCAEQTLATLESTYFALR